jgi:aminopeptidase N
MPTIDKPNQKTTEQIAMTVPDKYVTLSNGVLASQKKNSDGTRTDTWKMDLPNAPYLFFMGVGEYSIVKDSYKGKEVAYYVEKEYAPVARGIFGNTPEMIKFYSDKLGVDYPWPKYDQIVGTRLWRRLYGKYHIYVTRRVHLPECARIKRWKSMGRCYITRTFSPVVWRPRNM